jgi:hypothetical protein
MKTPMLLPWYARKAGVSIDRATELWQEAVRDSTDKTGWVGNTEYWGEAMHGFVDLLEREQTGLYKPDVCSLVRTQNRLWSLPLTTMETMFSAASAHWQRQMVNWRRHMNRTPSSTDRCSMADCYCR